MGDDRAIPVSGINRSAFVNLFRAVAILVVIGVHLSGYFARDARYQGIGIVAVNGFLVLSGFLLSGSYLRAVLNPLSLFPSSKSYAIRRLVRIYPAYTLAVVCTAAPYFFVRNHHGVTISDVVAHLTMTHGFFTAFTQSAFNVPLWTMAVDAQFYVSLPMVAFALRYVAQGMEPRERRMLVLACLAFVVGASLVLRLWVFRVTPAIGDYKAAVVYARNAVGVGSSFAFGVLIAFARIEGRNPSRSLSLGLVAVAGACTIILLADGAQFSRDYVVQVTYDFFGALAAAALLYGLGQGSFRSVHRAATLRAVTWISDISFGLYLYHKPFSILAIHLIGRTLRPHTFSYGAAITVFTLTCSTFVATIVFRYVEMPVQAWRRRTVPRAVANDTVMEPSIGSATA